MLKSCWDCIAGYNANRERGENGDAYNIRLNGDTQRAPPWPVPQSENEIMFLLPKQLNVGDRIDVTGRMTNDPQRFTVSLVTGSSSPDMSNIACQFEARFPSSNENRVLINIVQNGYREEINGLDDTIPATDWFSGTDFRIGFIVKENYSGQKMLDLFVGQSSLLLDPIQLKHRMEDIRFLTIQGDVAKVDKLDFQFA